MKKNILDFIIEQPVFNDCTFCKTFSINGKCPLKDIYKNDEKEPSKEWIEQNFKTCQNYVMTNLKYLLALEIENS